MKIRLKDILTIDFETYYGKDYSLTLKKYNTSSYIRDPQFKVHCLGVKDGTKKAVWYPGEEAGAVLKRYGAASRPIMCHNTQFDGFILSEHFGIVPPFYLDTLAMARGLHGTLSRNDLDTVSKLYGRGGKVKPHALKKVKGKRDLDPELLELLGEYCAGDVDECYEIGKIQLQVYPAAELKLIDWTTRAFCDPVLELDEALVREEYEEEVSGKAAKRRAAMAAEVVRSLLQDDGDGKSTDELMVELLQSADKFAAALEALGVDPPMKISPKTGELTYAFAKNDLAFQELLEHENEVVVALVEARLATKSTGAETRAARMLELAGKKVPVAYNYCLAHTTRWTGGNKLNFQNLRRQGFLEDGKTPDPATGRLRRSLKAPKGHVIVVVDSAQIEARFNAWLSGQDNIVQAFADYDAGKGPDVYRIMAAMIYGVAPDQVTKMQRFIGKIAVLGLGYGMGWMKFQATLAMGTMGPPVAIDDREARRIVNMYRRANDKIVEMWARCEDILAQMMHGQPGSYKCFEWDEQTVWMPNGLGLHYYGLAGQYDERREKFGNFSYLERGKRKKIYGGLFLENLVQGHSRVIVGEQLLKINEQYRVVLMTHDENAALARKTQARMALKFMLDTMKTTPAWAPGLVLNAEGDYDVCYSK